MKNSGTYLAKAKHVLLLGAAGTGMRGLAHLLANRDISISCNDQALTPSAAQLEPGLDDYNWVTEKEAVALASQVDLVIRSDSVPLENEAVENAAVSGVTNLIYSEALGELTSLYTTIAVAGTHGKTSTTALLAHILITAGLDPTVSIGASIPAWGNKNARIGSGDLFIVEADEYRNHFHHLRPTHAIITNIDYDHPDFYDSLAQTRESFQSFLDNLPTSGRVVVPSHVATENHLKWPQSTIRVQNGATVQEISGEHMRMNAALAIAIAELVGVSPEDATEFLRSFSGVSRRMENLGTIDTMRVYSDYGHHPVEIAATLAAARERFPQKRISVYFEAHTLERLSQFTKAFAEALLTADSVTIVPVFLPPGRDVHERKSADSKARELLKLLKISSVECEILEDYTDLESIVVTNAANSDIAIAFTAGLLDGYLRKLPGLS